MFLLSSCVAVYERDDVQAAPQGEDVHFAFIYSLSDYDRLVSSVTDSCFIFYVYYYFADIVFV